MFLLYAKTPHHKRFLPMDYAAKMVVANRIHATLFTAAEAEALRQDIPELERRNYPWKFELRPTN